MRVYLFAASAAVYSFFSVVAQGKGAAALGNGDVISGDLQAWTAGVVRWQTPYGAALELPAADLKLLQSDGFFRVTALSGESIAGQITVADGRLVVRTQAFGEISLPILAVARVEPLECAIDATAVDGRIPAADLGRTRGGGDAGGPAIPMVGEEQQAVGKDEAIRYALRRSGYLLGSGQSDLTIGVSYRRDAAADWFASRARQAATDFSWRRGFGGKTELSLVVPMGWRSVEALDLEATAPALEKRTKSRVGVGDIHLGVRRMLWPERDGAPETIAFTDVAVPVGAAPDPARPLDVTLSDGGYRSVLGLSFIKASDPLVLFGSVYYSHTWNGLKKSTWTYSDVVGLSGGFAFAINHETALSAEISWQYQGRLRQRGTATATDVTEPLSLRVWLTYRAGGAWTWEPYLRFGINADDNGAELGGNFIRKF